MKTMSGKTAAMSRRAFLRAAAGGALAAPYIVSARALGKDGVPAASERITMAAIGVGGQGMHDTRSLLNDARVQYVAVCDVQKKNAERARQIVAEHYGGDGAYPGCQVYSDFRQILQRPDIDAVNIAAPDHWHAIIAIQAAQAGKDIYCQKPLSLTVEQGRKMAQAAKRYGVVFQTGTQQRSEERFRRACELVRNGRIGKVRSVEVEVPGSQAADGFYEDPMPEGFDYDMWLGPAPAAPFAYKRIDPFGWRWIFDYAGGCVTDWGAHHIDIAQWGLGTTLTGPVEVEGEAVYPAKGMYNTALHWRYQCRYKNGVTLTCFAKDELRLPNFPNGVKFIGDSGWLYVNRGGMDAEPKSILQEKIGPDETHLYVSKDHYRNFIDCVISRQTPAACVEEAHRSVTICHLANIAMRLQCLVRWNPDTEQILGDEAASRMLSRPMRPPWRL
ncbi:MAG: Gfo/Idh/MocA family oxidoreductase [Phycisphaerae bacterium]|nr:Gfo/Idh/MocA family oxidoreductase [Phycisphaerae bacterium]